MIPALHGILQSGSLSATDPDFPNVSLLLPLDGANGSTTFTDASSNNLTATRLGNAVISTADSQWGGSSLYLPNSGQTGAKSATADGISFADSTLFEPGTGDGTFEAWIKITGTISTQVIAGNYLNNSGTSGWNLSVNSSRQLQLGITGDGIDLIGSTSLSLNTWYYVGWKRQGTTLSLFYGTTPGGSTTIDATTTNSDNITGGTFRIGSLYIVTAGFTGYYNHFQGYIDDIRFTKGVARDVSQTPTGPFPTS